MRLIGTSEGAESEIPPMDGVAKADAYCALFVSGPDGEPYPADGIHSRVCYRTTRPKCPIPPPPVNAGSILTLTPLLIVIVC